MLEPPSDALVAGLAQLGLCRAADWRRARSRVRKLARDLPAFDSVWIDALVTLGLLSPFQARMVEDGRLADLEVGPCILIDQLGHSRINQTWLARNRAQGDRCVVKRIPLPPENSEAALKRLELLANCLSGLAEPHVVGPAVCQNDAGAAILVSHWVAGVPLSELLVRRGRFPASVVVDFARQLLAGLEALHQRNIVHGDLRLSNIRLTDAGRSVLVDAGIRPALSPELQLHAIQSPEACDTTAPELIGTGLAITPAADLYALGCVLWQLLAGRPPFPIADPLAKLAAHQTGRVPDVRDWAPNTPDPLADLILRLTAPRPADRPPGAAALLEELGRPGLHCRARLRTFRKLFDGAVPHLSTPASRGLGGWAWTAATIFLLSGLAVTLSDSNRRGELLSLWSPNLTTAGIETPLAASRDETHSPDQPKAPLRTLLELPDPDSQGVLTLATGTYSPRTITQVGSLAIRADHGARPVIKIGDRPWQITAREFALEGVAIQQTTASASAKPLRALLLIRTQSMTLQDVAFAVAEERPTPPPDVPAVAWTQIDRQDRTAGLAVLQNVTATRPGPLLFCREAPREITFDNCLKTEAGAALVVYQSHSTRPIHVGLTQSTLRGSGPLISLWGEFAERSGAARLQVDAVESVFAPADDTPALIELAAERLRHDWSQAVVWTGESSLLPSGLELVSHRDPVQHTVERLESTDVSADGLTVDAFEFAGPSLTSPPDSRLSASQAPRRSTEFPGFRP